MYVRKCSGNSTAARRSPRARADRQPHVYNIMMALRRYFISDAKQIVLHSGACLTKSEIITNQNYIPRYNARADIADVAVSFFDSSVSLDKNQKLNTRYTYLQVTTVLVLVIFMDFAEQTEFHAKPFLWYVDYYYCLLL